MGRAVASFNVPSAGGANLVLDVAVAADTVVQPPSVAAGGQFLTCFLTFGSTPHAVTWGSISGSAFKHAPAIAAEAGMISVIVFAGRADGNWWYFPLLGVHP